VSKIIQGVSLDESVFKATKLLAKQHNRPWSNYVNMVLLDHIKGQDERPKKKNSKLKRRKE